MSLTRGKHLYDCIISIRGGAWAQRRPFVFFETPVPVVTHLCINGIDFASMYGLSIGH